jgi:hypothetical protein
MKIGNENSEADLARRYALQKVEDVLRNLAANILRVVRGAGKSWEIPGQAQEFADALAAYKAAVGHLPPSEDLDRMLSISRDASRLERMEDEVRDKVEAQETIIGGALRIVAARLLDQHLQVAAGEKEFHDGLRYLEEAGETLRKKRQAEQMQRARNPPPARRR